MNKNNAVEQWLNQLQLHPHPEGGYYKEVIKEVWNEESLRPAYSSIYFLLTHDNISHFHRIDADEIWYYHAGDSRYIQKVIINKSR